MKRADISKILIKWNMPTRQVAIGELLALHNKELDLIIGEDESPDWKDIDYIGLNPQSREKAEIDGRNQLRAEQRKVSLE